ncbi:hypothetical protein FE374_14235 [Georgenia yuyongxinii]|uniref:Uncharacterized protein n=1 Tax=Georgenia yuyongxinii TaxID=2589797 RepID=A0A5B8C4C6_9MICO|nr:DUF6541 family protein [Georgenia yuyongxinii]QDC25609.1 hypothetical protein FE374_14235 [Georgenia yuyongxinii]
MSWWAALPGALALVALWVLPGWAVTRALGARGIVGLGAGPAVTAAMLGGLGVLYGAVGVRWSLGSALTGLLGVVLLAAAAGALLRRRSVGRLVVPAPGAGVWPGEWFGPSSSSSSAASSAWWRGLALPAPFARAEAAGLTLALAVAAVLIAGPMVAGMGAPDRPEQAWDAVFHLNALALVRESGNASTLGALAPMYGGGRPYYPIVWHAMAAVAPGLSSVPAAANLQNLVLGAVVWPAGVAALTRVAVRPVLPALVAPVLAASFVAYPTVVLTVLAPWPYGLSIAVLPGALAALVVALRTPWMWGPKLAGTLIAALALGGTVAAHGSGAFSVIAVAGALVVVVLARQARHWWAGRPRLVTVVAVACAGLFATSALAVARFPALRSTLGFERGGADSYVPTLKKLLVDAPLVYEYGDVGFGHVAVTVLAAVGAVVCLLRRRARWLVLGWAGAVVLVLLAAGPVENPLRGLTGFWYTQAARIAPLIVLPAALLAAVGLTAVGDRLARLLGGARGGATASGGPRALVASVAVLVMVVATSGGMRWGVKERVTASVYEPGQIAWGTMLTEAELAMMQRLPDQLPADAVVLGDPFNGSAYLPALAGVDVVFPQLGAVQGAHARTLESSLDQIRTDPAVCGAATALGVTHVYTDNAGAADGAKVHERTAAMRALDTSSGFELVDSGGTARVWRLTAC